MVQDIITYTLITASASYLLFGMFRIVFPLKKSNALHCKGCKGCNIRINNAIYR
jgi:hypothetical protein